LIARGAHITLGIRASGAWKAGPQGAGILGALEQLGERPEGDRWSSKAVLPFQIELSC
jgi:hypothetical protein